MSAQPTYLEKVESHLVDQFCHGLHRILLETIWSDVKVGAWDDDLKFFTCLNTEYEYLLRNRTKPVQVEMHLRSLNFSGQETVSGLGSKYFESQLPCNRQKLLLLHALRLMLDNRTHQSTLSLLIPAIRREIHQSLRLVFFYLKGDSDSNRVQDFIDKLDQFDWLEMNHVRLFLADYLTSWLERQGVERTQVDDVNKLRSFSLTLTRWIYYHPNKTPGPPVHFEYGHIFRHWQRFGFFSSMHYEIDRLTSLVYLEGLSHSAGHSLDGLTGIPDRKSFDDEIQRRLTQFKTDQKPFICGMIDLDDFKKVNDTYGHQTGDFVLKEAAAFLKATLGPTDFVARFGGEEFVLLFGNLSLRQADGTIADAISRLGDLIFEYQTHSLRFTFSCGLAECLPGENVESLIKRADKNMYEAKQRGKNQVFSGFNGPIGVSRVRSADANQ